MNKLSGTCGTIKKRYDIQIVGISEGEENESSAEKALKEVMDSADLVKL